MKKRFALIYGIVCYLLATAVFLYFIGFVGDIVVPKTIDSGTTSPIWQSVAINVALLTLFGIQHSLMARASFKERWTKIVPKPIERSTYVLFASLILGLIMWQWRPLPTSIWNVQADWLRIAIWGLFGLGWIIVLASSYTINGFQLFGVQQVRQYAQEEELTSPEFQTPGLYGYVRHPLLLGFLTAFWAIPQMSAGHLLFATTMTVYIFIGMYFEERTLVRRFPDRYREYQKHVPRIIPRLTQSGQF